jgi:hypothetical protein
MKLGDKDVKQIKIVFDVEKQKYPTLGDYEETENEIVIKISKMSTPSQLAVAIHEFVEVVLCKLAGVNIQDIDEFDIEYENARDKGEKTAPCGCLIQEEPGNDVHAPYYKQHKIAENFEYQFLHCIADTNYERECNETDI